MNPYTVSVVLPLYNPKGTWAEGFVQHVRNLNAALPAERIRYIVVHDGPAAPHVVSTFEVIAEVLPEVHFCQYHANRGKGFALRHGVRASQTEYTIMVDFDFPYALENILTVLADLQLGTDVVVGRRSSDYFSNLPLKRKLISRGYSLANQLLFQLPVYDTQSGLKGFNRSGRAVFLQTVIDRFLIDTEFLLRAARQRLRVGVIEVHLRPHVTFSNFGWKVLRAETRNLWRLVRLNRELHRRYRYGNAELASEPGVMAGERGFR
ncbi:glycosyltransferase family 2 protein [Flaviaesturariibacter amylovorans]|uniref:Glycosyltransferase 2-like domain-containing protein n=1 Tax=Flaviaesturariibacter amylovorans TaxID=1084520 RepID=A0ABP8HP79_9BACT